MYLHHVPFFCTLLCNMPTVNTYFASAQIFRMPARTARKSMRQHVNASQDGLFTD